MAAEFAPMFPMKGNKWQRVASAPFERELELAVITYGEVHALVFPCRRILNGWINAETKKVLDVRPTHWREWSEWNES